VLGLLCKDSVFSIEEDGSFTISIFRPCGFDRELSEELYNLAGLYSS